MSKFISKIFISLLFLIIFSAAASGSNTPNKNYNNQTTGSNTNTWGVVLNSNFTTIDNNLGGTLTLSVAGNSNVTISLAQAQNLIYDFTGVLTGNIVIYFPAQGGFYYVNNQTTGAYTITIESTGDSSGILVPQGGGLPIIVDNSTSPPTTFSPNYASAGANSNITSLTGLTTPLSAAQGGSAIYAGGTSGGTANAQTLATVVPANFALTAGNIVTGIAGYTNSGATTLAVNSLSAKSMRKKTPAGLAALSGGEIIVGNSYLWYYDGTYFDLINPSTDQFTTAGTIASATTTDLGTVATNIQTISGTTTITGFGSSASAANPLYFITFSGALTLTNNATSLILPGAANITTAAGDSAVAQYLGSGDWQVISYNPASGKAVGSSTPAYNYISGDLISSIAGTHTTASFSISAGQAADSTNTAYITGAGYSWAASNGNAINGTDASSSTLANSTTYHVYEISGTSGTGSYVSATYPCSGLSPPSGYTTYCRRIGSFNTNSSGNPIPLNTQVEIGGGAVLNYLTTQTQDVSVSNLGASRVAYTLNVPTGIKVQPLIRAFTITADYTVILTSGDETDVAPSAYNSTVVPTFDIADNGEHPYSQFTGLITTNTSGQIGARANGGSSCQFYITTRGWIDFRRN